MSASVLSKIDDEKEEQAVVGSVGEHKADDSVGVARVGPAKKESIVVFTFIVSGIVKNSAD